MICKPKIIFYDRKEQGSDSLKNPLFSLVRKQSQPALYNGHILVMSNHARPVVHDSEDTREISEITRKRMMEKMKSPLCMENKVRIAPLDYSKENLLAIFAPQRNLTPEQIFWSIDNNDRKKAETSVPKPLSALTVSKAVPRRASGSNLEAITKHNRILPAKSVNNKKVEEHPRTNKSVWTKVNRVDSSISSKHVALNVTPATQLTPYSVTLQLFLRHMVQATVNRAAIREDLLHRNHTENNPVLKLRGKGSANRSSQDETTKTVLYILRMLQSTNEVCKTLSHAMRKSGGITEKRINSETDTGNSKCLVTNKVGSNSKQSHVALAGPNLEHMQDVFLATNYPKVHESLKHTTKAHVHLENPPSLSRTLSSMKNLKDS
ncbi:hypothetical protein Tco_0185805 [Tanacetum coccineum]